MMNTYRNAYIDANRYDVLPLGESLKLKEVLKEVYNKTKSIQYKIDVNRRMEALNHHIAAIGG